MLSVTVTDRPGACVTTAEVKSWLRIDHTADDALLSDMIIPAAQDLIEQATGLALTGDTIVTAQWDADSNLNGHLELPIAPYDSMIELTVNTVVIEDGDYTINGHDLYPVLEVQPGVAVKAEYLCGFASDNGYDTGKLPPALKMAVLNQCAWMYEHRGDGSISPEVQKVIYLYTRNLPV